MQASLSQQPPEDRLDAPAIAALQRVKLAALVARVKAGDGFYARKLAGIELDPAREPISKLPLTTRAELEADQAQHPPYGSNLTAPLADYCRFHQTSGSTSGRPLRWLDTAQNWDSFVRCWKIIYEAAGVTRGDRIAFTFSFGPFIGFWGAFESAVRLGFLAIPCGGLSTLARLRLIIDNAVGVVCCTPTYALHLAQAAREEGIDLSRSNVRALIVAGEPGGSVGQTRGRIEAAWGAGKTRVFDHTGMTEIGPVGFQCEADPAGVHLIESEVLVEVIDPQTLLPVSDGQAGELVVTTLGRVGSPVIRYRTGDQVRLTREVCGCGRSLAKMRGGILGRIDDLFFVRGNNVFPSALEAVIRGFSEVAEFRVTIVEGGAAGESDGPAGGREGAMTSVEIEVEPLAGVAGGDAAGGLAARVARAVADTLSFKAHVRTVGVGSLPRFEMKAKRFIRTSRLQVSNVSQVGP